MSKTCSVLLSESLLLSESTPWGGQQLGWREGFVLKLAAGEAWEIEEELWRTPLPANNM